MATTHPEPFTVIVHFEVRPENQQSFVDELTDTIANLAGFRSATFWASDDGTTVVNLAQWDSGDAYETSINSDKTADSGVLELVERHGAREVHLDSYRLARAFDR